MGASMRITVLLTISMFAFSFGQQTKRISPLPEQLQGDIIPNFSALAIDNETELSRSDLKEAVQKSDVKRIVISFFATWCVNCREEFVILKNNDAELAKNGVQVLLIDTGESLIEKSSAVEKFVKQFAGDAYPFWFDPNANMLKKFGLIGKNQATFELPITIVMDRGLKVLAVFKEIGKDYPQVLWSDL